MAADLAFGVGDKRGCPGAVLLLVPVAGCLGFRVRDLDGISGSIKGNQEVRRGKGSVQDVEGKGGEGGGGGLHCWFEGFVRLMGFFFG